MHRIELNLTTDKLNQVPQKIYKNINSEIIILDEAQTIPEGFSEIQENELSLLLSNQ